MRRTKPTLIYRRTKNLRVVQLLLGHTKLESTVRYLGIEVDDALEIAEQTEVYLAQCPVSAAGVGRLSGHERTLAQRPISLQSEGQAFLVRRTAGAVPPRHCLSGWFGLSTASLCAAT